MKESVKERILEINPDAEVEIYKEFFMPGSNLNIIKKDLLIITDPSILQIKDFSFQTGTEDY